MVELFTHPDRVRDAQHAAALVRALGAERVRVTRPRTHAWVLKDHVSIARVLSVVEPNTATTVEIEGITREATAPLLAKLVVSDAQFISFAGTTATLRVWPRVDQAFVDELALPRTAAFDRFRAACAVTWINGQVSEPGADAVALLPQIFGELDQPELEIDLDVSLDSALGLVNDFPDAELEWTGGAVIAFPSGEISTYKINPPPEFEAEWQARVSAALSQTHAGRA